MITRRRCTSFVLGLALVVAACGSEDAGPQVSAAPKTDTPTTSGSPVATTALPTTILVGWDNGVIAEHDVRTGKIVKTITTEAYPEGRFFGDLHRAPNGTVYVASGYEDSWYSCDYIDGDISVVDTDGSIDRIAAGGPPIISPDGSKLAYLTSSDCVTDPENEMWFVSNIDTLVVRTLATGAERSWTFPGARYESSAPSVLRSPVWTNGAVLVMSGDRMVTVDVSSSAVPPISGGTRVTLTKGSGSDLWLEAVRSDANIVAQWWPETSETDGPPQRRLVLIDPTAGSEVGEITTTDAVEQFAIDPNGQHWAMAKIVTVVVDGREIALEHPDSKDYVGDTLPMLVGW